MKRNQNLKANSQKLRREMTKEERKLWYQFLKPLKISDNVTFNRQKVIGNFIVDFYCAAHKLVIEIDGSQHYSEEGEKADMLRDSTLAAEGITVLRFSNADINLRFESCCRTILKEISG